MAFVAAGAKSSGLTAEADKAWAGVQLLQWVCDQKGQSTEALDHAYQQGKSAFRQLKKQCPGSAMDELLEMLPAFLLEATMAQIVSEPPVETRNE